VQVDARFAESRARGEVSDSPALDDRQEAALMAIALLCRVFAWPPEEPEPQRPRQVPE